MDQDRKSRMEPAEGSRETALENEKEGPGGREQQSGERMRNRETAAKDLGSSSDRAMLTGRASESRERPERGKTEGSERGSGSSGERDDGSTDTRRSNTGGITNREL